MEQNTIPQLHITSVYTCIARYDSYPYFAPWLHACRIGRRLHGGLSFAPHPLRFANCGIIPCLLHILSICIFCSPIICLFNHLYPILNCFHTCFYFYVAFVLASSRLYHSQYAQRNSEITLCPHPHVHTFPACGLAFSPSSCPTFQRHFHPCVTLTLLFC